MKLIRQHDPLDGGVLLNRISSELPSERNERWRGL